MSMRNIGAFAGGAAIGLRNGVEIGSQLKASDDKSKWYGALHDFLSSYRAGQTDPNGANAAPQAGKMASMGSGEDNVMDRTAAPNLGGGDASAMMQQGIGAMPGPSQSTQSLMAPPQQTSLTSKKLPFMEFLQPGG